MKVRIPILVVHGYYEFDVEAEKLPEAVERLKKQEGQFLGQHVTNVKLNYDAAYEPEPTSGA